jgi:hypothetical protein
MTTRKHHQKISHRTDTSRNIRHAMGSSESRLGTRRLSPAIASILLFRFDVLTCALARRAVRVTAVGAHFARTLGLALRLGRRGARIALLLATAAEPAVQAPLPS